MSAPLPTQSVGVVAGSATSDHNNMRPRSGILRERAMAPIVHQPVVATAEGIDVEPNARSEPISGAGSKQSLAPPADPAPDRSPRLAGRCRRGSLDLPR